MKLSRGVFFFLVISALFFPACGKFGQKKTIPGPNDKVYPVGLSAVAEREVPDVIKMDGRFIPHNELQIKSDFTGKVQALSVREGQSVLAGEVLLKVEDERLPFVQEQQRSALREAEAQLELDRSRGFAGAPETPTPTQEGTEEGQQEETTVLSPNANPDEEQQAPEEGAQDQVENQEDQNQQDADQTAYEDQTPAERLARLRQRAQQARAAAQARLRSQGIQTTPPQEQPAQENTGDEAKNREALDQAKIDRLRAELALTEKQMEGSTLTTSFEGMVTKLEISEGSLVKPGDILLEIVTLEPIELSLKIPKEEIAQIDKRMAVKVTVPDLGNRSYPGEISFIGAALEQDQKTVEIRVRVDNPELKIKIGMEGIAEMAIEKASHRALMVPEAALVRRDGKSYVYTVDGQAARLTEVDTGASVEGWVEIRHGLRSKDQVVTRGVEQLQGSDEFIRVGT